ncbi:MAG: sulfatase-like hydrolase/transferase [Mariniblastus sp.]|nr:sulfatase-like hydrolase/transferase [Mariniblastus sp.]
MPPYIFKRIALLGFAICYSVNVATAADPPNVVVFLMDDMGYGDSRVYNPAAKVAMPNLEAMAAKGMVFSDAHAPAAVCAPSRYSVLTGNYPWRGRLENGTWLFHQRSQIFPGQKTLGHLMQNAGYQTAFIGKVHLGGTVFSKTTGKPVKWKLDYQDIDFDRPTTETPASQGFDYAFELPQGIQGPPYIAFENGRLVGSAESLKIWEAGNYGNSIIPKTGFGSADWDSSMAGPTLTHEALEFINQHLQTNQKNGNRQPFFIHYCCQSCHIPHSPPLDLDGTPIKGVTGDPHLDILFEADVTLGKIVDRLRQSGELDNTLFLFTSDNGGLSRGRGKGQALGGHDSCAGLRGSKALIYEGGHRVPLIARWGDGTAAGSVIPPGSHSDAIIGLQDIYATLSELTRQALPVNQGLDSQSFFKILRGQTGAPSREFLMVQANNGKGPGQRLMKMLRQGNWKLITTKELEPKELYNLGDDLMEENNLIADPAQQTRVKIMQAELTRIRNGERSTPPLTLKQIESLPSPLSTSVNTLDLFAPQKSLLMKVKSEGTGQIKRQGEQWRVTGKSPLTVRFVPRDGEAWDISQWNLAGVPVETQNEGVTIIDAKLENSKPLGWSRHAVGLGVAPAGQPTMIGFIFPKFEATYDGPDIFRDQLAKPNGHRMHWRRFFPNDVRALKLEIRSSRDTIDLLIDNPILAWAKDAEVEKKLYQLPYLDALGQVRALEWPGKSRDANELRDSLKTELSRAADKPTNPEFTRYGGWASGPKLKATGHFRTQKHEGKWWLIDPDGHLFFSVGVCSAGFDSRTKVTPERRQANFFEWLPEWKDPLHQIGIPRRGKAEVNFAAMNYRRALGENWNSEARAGIHDRLRNWGINTLGTWADQSLQQDGRTPYTLIASMWWQSERHFPSPFRADFESDLRKILKKYQWAKDDPYCLGLFLGNELEWPDRFTPAIYSMDKTEPTKIWALDRLKEKHKDLIVLNKVWGTNFSKWSEVLESKSDSIPKAAFQDIDPLYFDFAQAYFSKTRKIINEMLPNKLYLGCRTHRGPNVLGRAALGHVDVFSVNVYDSKVRSSQVPDNIDIPVLVGEFHFGASDRGVPSPGLSGVWDQRQRGLAFANYLASALANPRYVGIHWFRWLDQSAAGRQDRENHQCGFVDVTGRSYTEFVDVVAQATQAMYPARASIDIPRLRVLESLIRPSDSANPPR